MVEGIVVNGDLLGFHNIKKDYGYGYRKDELDINLIKLFQYTAPFTSGKILQIFNKIKKGEELDEQSLTGLSEILKDYIDERYMWLLNSLRKLSKLSKVYFNLGNHESPLHYLVVDELAFILGMEKEMITKIIDQTHERDHFYSFKQKLKQMEQQENFIFISQKAIIDGGVLISGIPGLHHETGNKDEKSDAQEKITVDTLEQIKEKLKEAKALLMFNHVKGRINKKPFLFEPVSENIKAFLENNQDLSVPKLFCESDESFVTTHFYQNHDWYFMHNNAGVNNGLFNMIDIGSKIVCYDIDPNLDQLTTLTTYDLEKANYGEPITRMRLNYPNPQQILMQRKLDNTVYNL